jgi:excisionase family DNA binding protein
LTGFARYDTILARGYRMDENKSDWLTVGEVADELGFSRTTVYGWLEEGLLVGHRIAGSWRVKRHDLDAFIAAGRNVPEVTQKGITP